MLLAPVVKSKKGMHEKIFEDAKKNGYVRVRIDGRMYDVSEAPELEKNKKHTVEVVIDRLIMKEGIKSRLTDSAENALNLAKGNLLVITVNPDGSETEYAYSQNYACEEHNFSMGELSPRMFSFNNPYGACDRCAGIGEMRTVSFDLICPDKSLSLAEGAIAVNGFKSLDDSTWTAPLYEAVGKRHGFTLDTPIKDYSKKALDALLNGTQDEIYEIDRYYEGRHAHQTVKFEGILNIIEQRYNMSQNEYYEEFFEFIPCPKCKGRRLKDEILAVTVCGKSIDQFCSLSIDKALTFVEELKLSHSEERIARDIVKELKSRLGFLKNVGLGYLTLSRKAGTLSGGESQRIRLATQIGSSLMGVLYILDEPSIGLHQRDNHKLIEALKALRNIGNSLIVVEHDEETMMEADYIVDIGPGAGVNGGNVVAVGTPQEIMDNPQSITGDYLSGRRKNSRPLRQTGRQRKFSPDNRSKTKQFEKH